ncbi:MAG: phosphoribosylformylglycinamidine cyclo-ligase [Candidatus Eisenbacteria bacterium]|uniref:Phosphoribosylformylglycinamidine cyclo-ligase n=1 Tax=Eiseniibacteriota bacterium TaxID=2212470 RepID=A0A849SN48_UNCEI|nr:phosphoribosylformylglycinamidine cyclo-ligase [Candidatus Eisenbacteria bacterium]
MRYDEAGVDVAAGDAVKRTIGECIRSTWGPAVHPIPGGFAGVMRWPAGDRWMAATMDGVGTKLHLALAAGRLEDACADLVYHCADDLLAHGARPLAFLDYLAQARLDAARVEAAVRGMARACSEVGAALLGGETAQMPDTYLPGVIDVAGCMIGEVDGRRLRDGSAVTPGDVLIGLGAEGLHTNGFSLARRVLERTGASLDARLPGGDGESLADSLLAPHRWYGRAVEPLLDDTAIHALAHITGGGIAGNLVRVLPTGCAARIRSDAWPRPAVFGWLASAGSIDESELRHTFNLGIGLILICEARSVAEVTARLTAAGERAWRLGEIEAGSRGVSWAD